MSEEKYEPGSEDITSMRLPVGDCPVSSVTG